MGNRQCHNFQARKSRVNELLRTKKWKMVEVEVNLSFNQETFLQTGLMGSTKVILVPEGGHLDLKSEVKIGQGHFQGSDGEDVV